MARPLRVEVESGFYHVIVRGNDRRSVFRDDGDRRRYLARLAFYAEKYAFRVVAYCLMDNDVHLAIERGKVALAKVMAGLRSSYTQYFNRRHGRSGHLFQGRYKAFLVEKDRYALALLRYIHENPVKARVVERAADFDWSSDRHYRLGRGPAWLGLDLALSMLGRRRSAATRAYRRLMREPVEKPYEDVSTWGQAVKGDESFADRALRAAGEVPFIPRGLTVEKLARRVAHEEGLDLPTIRGPSRERAVSRARLMVAWVGREVGRIPVAQTARFFGRDTSVMIKGLNRLESLMEEDGALQRKVALLRAVAKRSVDKTIMQD